MKLSSHAHISCNWWSQPSQHHSMNQFSCNTKHIGANCPKLVSQITKETAIHLIIIISRIFKVAASEQLGYSKKLIKPAWTTLQTINELYTRETS